jgi:hypothetical protein
MEADYIREDDPYGIEIEAVDSLKPGDVVVHSTDAAGTNAPWGGDGAGPGNKSGGRCYQTTPFPSTMWR